MQVCLRRGSFSEEAPVVFSMGRSTDVVKTEEAPLTTFMEQAGSEMAALYETAQRCNATLGTEIAGLNLQNGDLGQQLEASMGRERDWKILHGAETQVLKDEVALLKEQMAQLREESRREAERLQRLLTAAQQEKTTALELAKRASDQQKTLLEQQKTALQGQLSSKDSQISSKDSQISSLNRQIQQLKDSAHGETPRQEAAIRAKLQEVYADLAGVINKNIEALRVNPRSYTSGSMGFTKRRPLTAIGAYKWMRDELICYRLDHANYKGIYRHDDEE